MRAIATKRNVGTVAFGVSAKLAAQIGDIARHTALVLWVVRKS